MKLVQKVEYPLSASKIELERWADSIPCFADSDPTHPEWQPTPCRNLDLSQYGLGTVLVKDESVNPTGTFKDRMAWEVMPCLYRDWARRQLAQHKYHPKIPRISLLSSGSALASLAFWAEKYALPPPRGLVDDKKLGQVILPAYADVAVTNFSKTLLDPAEILKLTSNKRGVDITSITAIEPHATFYDWLAFEVLNTGAKTVYVPYGSGRLMENLLTWQYRCQRMNPPDARLQVPVESLSYVSIRGCEPARKDSVADKLTAPFKPFAYFHPADVRGLMALGVTGKNTRVTKVAEKYIEIAHAIFGKQEIMSEPSGAAGLAGVLQDADTKSMVEKPVLVVNTGKSRLVKQSF